MRLFLEPTETLLFRTGRPFNAGESSYADTLFPPTPETLQGAIRAAIATHWDRTKTLAEVFQQQALVDLIGNRNGYGRFRITGIALGRRKKDGAIERIFPAPVHRQQVKDDDGKKHFVLLKPKPAKEEGVYTDLSDDMQLLYSDRKIKGKQELTDWLTEKGLQKALRPNVNPAEEEMVNIGDVFEYEARLGIGINNETKTTKEGLLYQTRMVRMNPKIDHPFVYGFVLDIHLTHSSRDGDTTIFPEPLIDDDQTQKLLRLPDQGWITLGGERRTARFEVHPSLEGPDSIEGAKRGNLIYLATPASLEGGWQPKEWKPPLTNPIAAAIDRYVPIGGWLLTPDSGGGENKSMRRCVPAGSIYFFDRSITITRPLTDYGWQIGYGIAYAGEW